MNQKKNETKRNLTPFHRPVLLNEAIEFLNVKPGEVYIDATIGGGGHSKAILEKGGRVFGLDCDPAAVWESKEYLNKACPNTPLTIVKANFVNLTQVLKENKIANPAGIIFDLGTSFYQLKTKERGFSFNIDETLDMRMDPELKVKAVDLINGLGKAELYELFYKLGEEKLALPIAKAVVFKRKQKPITTTNQLASLAVEAYKKRRMRTKIHPATKVFQALRIAVNDELNNLRKALPQAVQVLRKKGRLVVISFHGLEDRIVKRFLKEKDKQGEIRIMTKKPVRPSWEEVRINPSARSAKLRAGEKI